MLGPGPQKPTAAAYRSRVILWLAMALATPVYFLVAWLVPPIEAQENSALVKICLLFAAGCVAASFAAKNRLLVDAGQGVNPARRQQAEVLALALCEAAALFGIVIRFTTGWTQYYLFLVLGLAGILLHYPRREE
jgi:hypothetical protein